MAWIYLLIAGLLEVVWAYTMKLLCGFTRPGPTSITIVTMIGSFALLASAMRTIPLSTAYLLWTGIGAVGAFLLGTMVLGEPISTAKIVAAVLVATGLVLLKVAG